MTEIEMYEEVLKGIISEVSKLPETEYQRGAIGAYKAALESFNRVCHRGEYANKYSTTREETGSSNG